MIVEYRPEGNKMRQRDRWQKQAASLRKQVIALEGNPEDLVKDDEHKGIRGVCYGRRRPENDFDQRDHYREM
jgi:hypothetical protein